jgi:hypothetical protein
MYGQSWSDLGATPSAVSWQMLRTLRHSPPGRATKGARKNVFNAALEQAEQLFIAAASVGTATSPLLAFYGLSQAGRAVAAVSINAGTDDWELVGHGIGAGDLRAVRATSLAALTVRDAGRGSFTQLAGLLRCASLADATRLGDLWGVIPDSAPFPLPGMGERRTLVVQAPASRLLPVGRFVVKVGPFSVPSHSLSSNDWPTIRKVVGETLADYPTLKDWDFPTPAGPMELKLTGSGVDVSLCLPSHGTTAEDETDLAGRTFGYRGWRLAFPTVGGSGLPSHPLLLWWSVLYALSMLARYSPHVWNSVISVDASDAAVAVEHIMRLSLVAVPELIHQTIMQASGMGA